MTAPLVSVLIPCWNSEKTICETLGSVLSQTWKKIEIIVVDDGSIDEGPDVVESYSARNVKLIRQRNSGAAAARNAAYRASSGEFIQFLDADDMLGEDKIERQMARLMDLPNCIASAEWGRFYVSTADAHFKPELVWLDLSPLDWLAMSRHDGLGMLFPAIWLAPRHVVDTAGPWDETLSLGDDGEYFTRVVLAAERVLFCSGAQCFYRSGQAGTLSGRKTPSGWVSAERVLDLSEKHVFRREDSERMRRAFSLSWQHLAHACYPYAPDIAECALKRAFALDPIRIQPEGGRSFKIISEILGWKFARRLQVLGGWA